MRGRSQHGLGPHDRSLLEAYIAAKDAVIARGFDSEIDWQEGLCVSRIGEQDFLRETAWVILSSGFREAVLRGLFPAVSRAFLDFASAAEIARHASRCHAEGLRVFRQPRKLAAIVTVADRVHRLGFATIKANIEAGGLAYLETFPYVGPVTRYHLAKNLGVDVVKPDRHLCRVARAARYGSPEALCRMISASTGDRLAVVDLVIWRFATIERSYLEHFRVTR